MTNLELLQQLTFGQQVAEQEALELSKYFISTYDWERVLNGQVDIVFGPKGSGKSAIYVALIGRTSELEAQHRIRLIRGENVQGDAVFKENIQDLPPSEEGFRFLWKLYFLALIVSDLKRAGVVSDKFSRIERALREAGVLPSEANRLSSILKAVTDYINWLIHPETVEVGIPEKAGGKITFREPSQAEISKGYISIEALYSDLNEVLDESDWRIWVALDRLDVAFVDNPEVEERALRALFRVYLDLFAFNKISLKMFLRTDIWKQITRRGFREASHITRSVTLEWTERNLLHLVASRIISNDVIQTRYRIDPSAVRGDAAEQENVFYCIFPDSIERGSERRNTFAWMLRRIKDANGVITPRELIFLLSAARDNEIRDIEVGRARTNETFIVSASAVREAWEQTSRQHLERNTYAEFAECRDWLERLRGKGIIWKKTALLNVWEVDDAEYERRAARLIEIGFWSFKNGEIGEYHIPYLFRPALSLIQRREE